MTLLGELRKAPGCPSYPRKLWGQLNKAELMGQTPLQTMLCLQTLLGSIMPAASEFCLFHTLKCVLGRCWSANQIAPTYSHLVRVLEAYSPVTKLTIIRTIFNVYHLTLKWLLKALVNILNWMGLNAVVEHWHNELFKSLNTRLH